MIRLIEWLETLKLYKDPEDTLRFQYADALLIYSLTSCLGLHGQIHQCVTGNQI